MKGHYVFADGLEYSDPADGEWSYCRPDGDRRFYSELVLPNPNPNPSPRVTLT